MFIRPHARFIIDSLKDSPQDWTFTEYHADNLKIGISLWTRNGKFALDLYPSSNKAFNIFEKHVIYKLLAPEEVFSSWKQAQKTSV